MRGDGRNDVNLFSYISPGARIPKDHSLRAIRQIVDVVLKDLSPQITKLYSTVGRLSIPPGKLLRALLLQVLYSIRSERLLMEQPDYNLLIRWFVGLNMDDPVWAPTGSGSQGAERWQVEGAKAVREVLTGTWTINGRAHQCSNQE